MTKQLTLDEVYEKYGDIDLQFSSYYKYCFTFQGELEDGNTVVVGVGGDSDGIYRFDVCAGNNGSLNGIKNCYSLNPAHVYVYPDESWDVPLEQYHD